MDRHCRVFLSHKPPTIWPALGITKVDGAPNVYLARDILMAKFALGSSLISKASYLCATKMTGIKHISPGYRTNGLGVGDGQSHPRQKSSESLLGQARVAHGSRAFKGYYR